MVVTQPLDDCKRFPIDPNDPPQPPTPPTDSLVVQSANQRPETYDSNKNYAPHFSGGYSKLPMSTARVLATAQTYSASEKRWGNARDIATADGRDRIQICLSRGGVLWLYPDMVPPEEASAITADLLDKPEIFRQYTIQGINNEPRLQAHFHDNATHEFCHPQPGYRYNKTTAKARPLSLIPSLVNLSNRALSTCNVGKWNIGVSVVLYRDGNDKMGQHSDDDQGETMILAVVVDAPTTIPRGVQIMPKVNRKAKDELPDGVERITLILRPGDAYSMDGAMQVHYTHGVARMRQKEGLNDERGRSKSVAGNRRIAIIFRDGRYVTYGKDSGRPCTSLKPRVLMKGPVFGDMPGLIEGCLYSRKEMVELGIHKLQQRGISGNSIEGCDAIVVSGQGGWWCIDGFLDLFYDANLEVGGRALEVTSFRKLPVRVFRSTAYAHKYRAVIPRKFPKTATTYYRYDGLYWIAARARGDKSSWRRFHLLRCDSTRESIPGYRNKIKGSEFHRYCYEYGTISHHYL